MSHSSDLSKQMMDWCGFPIVPIAPGWGGAMVEEDLLNSSVPWRGLEPTTFKIATSHKQKSD